MTDTNKFLCFIGFHKWVDISQCEVKRVKFKCERCQKVKCSIVDEILKELS